MGKASSSLTRVVLLLAGVGGLASGALRAAEEPVLKPAEAVAAVVPNSECMDCHEAEFKARKKGQPKEWIGVRPELFTKSVHGKLNCVDCHS